MNPATIRMHVSHKHPSGKFMDEPKNSHRAVEPRQVAMFLLRKHTKLSFNAISLRFPRPRKPLHPLTVRYGVQHIADKLRWNVPLQRIVASVEKELFGRAEGVGK